MESQDIEYKQSWHDDYLKWVCGFANAQGGTIYIGKDDDGHVVGVDDYKKLMDEIQITFWNEGRLPQDLTLEALTRPHSSKPRNILIADVCFKGGLIDAWGRGTTKIIESCKQAGLREPELAERDGGFLVTMFGKIQNEGVSGGLKDSEILLALIERSPGIQLKGIVAHIEGASQRTIERQIAQLKEKGLIERRGSRKTGGYWKTPPMQTDFP